MYVAFDSNRSYSHEHFTRTVGNMTSTAVIAHELRAFGFLFCFEFQVLG